MSTPLLYLTAVLIWGPTYYVVKFQIGLVDPLLSVAYRFTLAGVLLLGFCRIVGLKLSFSPRVHGFMLLQGLSLFGLNYWLMYQGAAYLNSGLIALVFSTIVMMNVINSAIFLGAPVRKEVVVGGLLGLLGIGFIFQPEVGGFAVSALIIQALIIIFVSVYIESMGNIISARNQREELPVIQTNAYSMLYGGSAMLIIAWVLGKPFTFDTNLAYIGSLLYLSVFGSIIGFGCYLTLIGRIGVDKAAYITLLVPVVALLVSTLLEGYQWNSSGVIGVCFVLLGNLLAMVTPGQFRQFSLRWKSRS